MIFFSNYLVDIDPSSLNNSNILYLESILSYLHLLNKYEEKVLIKKSLKKMNLLIIFLKLDMLTTIQLIK